MKSSASKSLSAAVAAVAVAAAVGTVWAEAPAVPLAPAVPAAPAAIAAAVNAGPNPFANRFTDVVLKTHEGKNVRFYDDLLKGKIVLINFMYASCKGR